MTGKELKSFRIKHGLSQSDLAEIVGVKTNTVSKWESGIRNIGQSAIKLLEAYVPELDKPAKNKNDLTSEDLLSKRILEEFSPKLSVFYKFHQQHEKTLNKHTIYISMLLDKVDKLNKRLEGIEEKLNEIHGSVLKK